MNCHSRLNRQQRTVYSLRVNIISHRFWPSLCLCQTRSLTRQPGSISQFSEYPPRLCESWPLWINHHYFSTKTSSFTNHKSQNTYKFHLCHFSIYSHHSRRIASPTCHNQRTPTKMTSKTCSPIKVPTSHPSPLHRSNMHQKQPTHPPWPSMTQLTFATREEQLLIPFAPSSNPPLHERPPISPYARAASPFLKRERI